MPKVQFPVKPNQEVIFPYLLWPRLCQSYTCNSATEHGLFQCAFGFRFILLVVFFHKCIFKTEAKHLPVEFETQTENAIIILCIPIFSYSFIMEKVTEMGQQNVKYQIKEYPSLSVQGFSGTKVELFFFWNHIKLCISIHWIVTIHDPVIRTGLHCPLVELNRI